MTDFLFLGAAVLPGVLAFLGQAELAALSCLTLLIAGALSGIADPAAPHRRRGGGPRAR